MSPESFGTAGRIVTGRKALDDLGKLARDLGERALIVTGPRAMREAGVTDRVIGILESASCQAVVFDQAPPEPTIGSVDDGIAMLHEHGADVVIGIGGGSAIDVAKAIGGLARGGEPTSAYFDGQDAPSEAVPIIAIPTTAGTGAEVTRNSVLSDPGGPTKQSIRGDRLMPAVALMDPELMVSMPPGVTARSGMDALTQAIESYWSIHATPITEGLALQAMERIADALVRAFDRGDDLDAREAMGYGSLIAGMAFANSRLGAVHGLAHPIGIRYHIPHGEVCAVLLPHVMRLNRDAAPAKYERINHILGGDAADKAAELLRRLDLPEGFGAAGLVEDDFDAIVAESMPSGSLKANPKKVTEDDLLTILKGVT